MNTFDNFPRNKEATLSILQQLELSEQAWMLFGLSFRTRVKETEESVISFQFRILPEKMTEAQKNSIDTDRTELVEKLLRHYPKKTFEVIIQVAPCCGSQCF